MTESFSNPPLDVMRQLLRETRSIAVVGLSDNPARPSHRVAAYLQAAGYRIVPVNPLLREALGEPAVPDLDSVPGALDMVCLFRRSEEVPPLAEAAVRLAARSLWMQDHVVHGPSALMARAAGLTVVMNDCLLRRHQQLLGPPSP
jgi:predicted CoA-binding protein